MSFFARCYRVAGYGWIWLLVLSMTPVVSAQGLLDRLRGDARAPRPADEDEPADDRDSKRKRRHDCNDAHGHSGGFGTSLLNSLFGADDDCHHTASDDSVDGSGVGLLLIAGVSSPWWVPLSLAGDDYSVPYYDLPFPYADQADGYLTASPSQYYFPEWSLRTQFDYGTDFENLSFINTRALLESSTRLGVDSEFRYWEEESELLSDELWTGDANLVFRFARAETFQMRTGLGFNWLADQIGSDFGFNFTYGGDWFPRRPFIISADLDWGTIAHSELFHARTTVGANVFPFEAYTGFDYYDATSFRVGSWISGLRLWF